MVEVPFSVDVVEPAVVRRSVVAPVAPSSALVDAEVNSSTTTATALAVAEAAEEEDGKTGTNHSALVRHLSSPRTAGSFSRRLTSTA